MFHFLLFSETTPPCDNSGSAFFMVCGKKIPVLFSFFRPPCLKMCSESLFFFCQRWKTVADEHFEPVFLFILVDLVFRKGDVIPHVYFDAVPYAKPLYSGFSISHNEVHGVVVEQLFQSITYTVPVVRG